jgi:hypothetical protein
MTNLLERSAQYLAGQQQLHLATTVVWSRGATSASVAARVGRTAWDVETGAGRVERVESRDYLVDPTALPVEPREGDTIVETIAGVAYRHTIAAPAGTPPVHWADAYRTTLRLHTKLVGKEAAA